MKSENVEELTDEKIEVKTDAEETTESVENKGTCQCDGKVKKELEEKITTLTEELNAKNEEVDKLVEKVKLAQAELINYRCRKDKEVQDTLKYCNQGIITDLIPIVDNFERAIKLDDNNLDDELSKFLVGFKMIYSSLSNVLKSNGVEEISRQGEVYDPSLEQALLTDKVEELENDVVIEVLQKGYKLKDRVIRAASVKVNQK